MNYRPNKANFSVIPPANFSYLEDFICRCSAPISRNSISFISSIAVGSIINISGKKLDPYLVTFCEEQGITIKTLIPDGESAPLTQISLFEKWLAVGVEALLFHSNDSLTLLMGSPDNYYDCLLVACMRRVQEWSYLSTVAEFRHHIWPHRLFDFEQLIEHFDISQVDFTAFTPDCIIMHENFKDEERKLLERCAVNEQLKLDKATTEDEISRKNSPEKNNSKASSIEIEVGDNTNNDNNNDSGSQQILNNIEEDRCSEDAAAAIDAIKKQKQQLQLNKEKLDLGAEQIRIDDILKRLFFSPRSQLISSGIKFDPALSLINEKDEED